MNTTELARFVADGLAGRSDPDAAAAMAAYMKTTMPFYGVKTPERGPVVREMIRRFPPGDAARYREGVLALWNQPHREEKYAALAYARGYPDFISREQLPLYEQLIREGAWWDLVDEVAIKLVGRVALRQPSWDRLDPWIDDGDMWIRRSAIICQNDHKEATDEDRLFRFCLTTAHEREFFILKAIGWALRQYSYVAPESVARFLRTHRSRLSGLSYREGAKALLRQGHDL